MDKQTLHHIENYHASSREQHILFMLGSSARLLHQHCGGQSGQTHILRTLLKVDAPLSQQELQQHFGIKPATLSESLSKLSADGLIEKTAEASDKRKINLSLTEKGIEAAKKAEEEYLSFMQRAFSCFSEEELAILENSLSRLKEHWMSIFEWNRDERPCHRR